MYTLNEALGATGRQNHRDGKSQIKNGALVADNGAKLSTTSVVFNKNVEKIADSILDLSRKLTKVKIDCGKRFLINIKNKAYTKQER